MKKSTLLKSTLLLCALVAGSTCAWATTKDITITGETFGKHSYSDTEATFEASGFTFGFVQIMSNVNGTPSGWGAGQILQFAKNKGTLYNNNPLGKITNVRVYRASGTTNFALCSGDTKNPTTNSVASNAKTGVTSGTETVTYTKYESKTSTPDQSIEITYFDFDLSSTKPSYIAIKATSSGVLYAFKIVITYELEEVAITSAQYATHSAPCALDYSSTGITVYTATDNENSVTLNEVTSGKVPANTPVVLYKADADGTAIDVPVIASADAPAGTNDLQVSDGTAGSYQYVLAKKTSGVGFYPWAGGTLSKGKIFLQGKASYGAREYLGFGDATGIKAVSSKTTTEKGEYYNLAGQRVAQPQNGLYIVNGKKVVIK